MRNKSTNRMRHAWYSERQRQLASGMKQTHEYLSVLGELVAVTKIGKISVYRLSDGTEVEVTEVTIDDKPSFDDSVYLGKVSIDDWMRSVIA